MSNPPSYKWYADFQLGALEREQTLDKQLSEGLALAEYVTTRNALNAERSVMNKRLKTQYDRPTHDITLTTFMLYKCDDHVDNIAYHWTVSDADFVILKSLINTDTVFPDVKYIVRAQHSDEPCPISMPSHTPVTLKKRLSRDYVYRRHGYWPQFGIIEEFHKLGLEFDLLEVKRTEMGSIQIRVYIK